MRHIETTAAVLVALCLILTRPAFASPIYYVDASTGDDTRTAQQAQNAATPWKTIGNAVSAGGLINIANNQVPLAGYTVVVQPGIYMESVQSKRDGLPADPVTIKAATPGTVTVFAPPGTIGVLVYNNYHVIDGLIVTGATTGIKVGPYNGKSGQPISGVVVRNNTVYGNNADGIQFNFGLNGEIALDIAYQNGGSGIKYEGNGSIIHDNVSHDNGEIGVYVVDGVNHQVWNNVASNNGSANIKVNGSMVPPPGGRTFYVGANGNDNYNEAQTPQTPWQTFRQAIKGVNPGDTLMILPGVYTESLRSYRDGTASAPITVTAAQPGTVTLVPAAGSGVFISNNYHTVTGLTVNGGAVGLQMGPVTQQDPTTGNNVSVPATGLIASQNVVSGSTIGIKFEANHSSATHNEIYNCGQDGILWNKRSGDGATIFNNLAVRNGTNGTGEFGITIAAGANHVVMNNTLYGNVNGGVRLGTSGDVPIFGTVVNNIVVSSPVGFKEPAGQNYVGKVTLDFNDVYSVGNTAYDLSPTGTARPGSNSISVSPVFVDPVNDDFRLGRIATGQPADSGVIDKGSDTASVVGLAGRTAFIDKYPDSGRVDLGYHGTVLVPSPGTLTIKQASLSFGAGGTVGLNLSAILTPGLGSDGLNPGVDYAEVTIGDLDLPLWIAGFQQQGGQWVFTGSTSAVGAVLQKQVDGSVTCNVQASGLALSALKFPTSITLRIGDDYGTGTVSLTGALQTP